MYTVSKTMLLLAASMALPMWGQNISGSIAGRLVDQSGGIVANAEVTADNPAQNIIVTEKTNEQGSFFFAALPPGTYTVSVKATGFKKLDKNDIVLDPNTKLALGDLQLQVGALTESVEVEAQGALLQTESVDRSATVSNRQMENIEVNGRNPST